MSSHLHIIVEDTRGEASDFMQYALAHAAKRINKLDSVRGSVVERRFGEIVILDRPALVQRIAYAIANPVEAGLVRSHREWTGLCLFAGKKIAHHKFTIFQDGAYERALDRSTRADELDRSDYFETAELEIAAIDDELARHVAAEIEDREAELRKNQKSVLGIKRVLRRSPFDRPQMPPRSPIPPCFASTRPARLAFIEGLRAFVDAFRQASELFRAGHLEAQFPMFSFRPSSATA